MNVGKARYVLNRFQCVVCNIYLLYVNDYFRWLKKKFVEKHCIVHKIPHIKYNFTFNHNTHSYIFEISYQTMNIYHKIIFWNDESLILLANILYIFCSWKCFLYIFFYEYRGQQLNQNENFIISIDQMVYKGR